MVSLTNNRSQERHKFFFFPRLTSRTAVASIQFGFLSYAPKQESSFDVIVVGSGASGGGLASACGSGPESRAPRSRPPAVRQEFYRTPAAFELKYRNRAPEIVRKTRPIQVKFGVCNEYTYKWFVNDLEEPYTTPADKPFNWMAAFA